MEKTNQFHKQVLDSKDYETIEKTAGMTRKVMSGIVTLISGTVLYTKFQDSINSFTRNITKVVKIKNTERG